MTTIEWAPIEHAHSFDCRLVPKPAIDGYGLIFREERRVDSKYTHRGQVWIPFGQYLYLVSGSGYGRLCAEIAFIPDADGKMNGIQLSQYNPIGAFLRREEISDEELGKIQLGHPLYGTYSQELLEALDAVVFALPQSS